MTASSNNPLRIALVNTMDYGGGAETVVRCLRDGLRERGHDVALWTRQVAGNEDRDGTHAIPATTEHLERSKRFAAKGFFGLGLPASRMFCDSDALDGADVIHLHNVHGHYLDLTDIPRLASRAPLVWTFHDHFPVTGGCAFPMGCDRWRASCGACPQLGQYPIASPFDRTRRLLAIKRGIFHQLEVTVVTPSKHLADAVARSRMFQRAEFCHIPYGVDTDLFQPGRGEARRQLGIHEERPVVLIVAQGLDDPRKGLEHALAALEEVTSPELLVLLAGTGDEAAIAGHLTRHEVRQLGYIRHGVELARVFAAADLFLFTSQAENFPCVVMESMASGTPVLAFDIAGVDEQIVHERTGFLVPCGQTIALARELERLLRDRDLLRQVGAAARRHAEGHWSRKRFLDANEQLYRRVTARRQALVNE